MGPGHVFITRGDLRHLACDGWLLPTDVQGRIHEQWQSAIVTSRVTLPSRWSDQGLRVAPAPVPEGESRTVWLVNVGASRGVPIEWYVDGVRQFVEVAGAAARGEAPRFGRALPLLGLPLVGTGHGGAAFEAGRMVAALLPTLDRLAARHRVDLVLVLSSPEAYAAAQAVRRQGASPLSPQLDERLAAEATRLGRLAAKHRLVLFLGAGASAGAGLPVWSELFERITCEAEFSETEALALSKLDPRDRARLIERRLEDRGIDLGERVALQMKTPLRSLTQTLLASLPVREVATTNYDQMFEGASADAGVATAALPYEPVGGSRRWILKMHGCISRPEDIVLTRDDYLRYSERRAALAGIVQALLVTRHMLFIGFSLTDDNFHRIAHDVRKAIRVPGAVPEGDRTFGTALLLDDASLLGELWRGDLVVVSLAKPAAPGQRAAAARRLEVFLDGVGTMASTGVHHLLRPAFDGVLTDEERAVRNALGRLAEDLQGRFERTAAGRRVSAFLRSMGHRTRRSARGS